LAGESLGSLYGDEVGGTVSAHADRGVTDLGGLVGRASGSIVHCSSTANVIAPWSFAGEGGGLVGADGGIIDDSFATGNVTGILAGDLGGLAGLSSGLISHSHATGDVSATEYFTMGGLVGWALGPIANSYATGDLRAGGLSGDAGGLVGTTSSSIDRSFATGSARARGGASSGGGLVGTTGITSSITNSYATGAVAPAPEAGGLVGFSPTAASITTSYATGRVSTGYEAGGFVCGLSVFANDYWDTTIGGTYGECGNQNVSGVTGLTTTQLQSGLPAGFDPKIWAQDRKINRGFPYLIANPPPQ
jgi:hypothetical protein